MLWKKAAEFGENDGIELRFGSNMNSGDAAR